MPFGDCYLSVPKTGLGQRRSSEGYLNANDMLSNYEEADERDECLNRRRGTNPSIFDGHFLEALRKNCVFASTLSDIEDHREEAKKEEAANSMVRGGPVTRTTSPRPLILQQQVKWRNDESTSISSNDSDELSPLEHPHSKCDRLQWLRKEAKSFVDDVVDAFEAGSAPMPQSTSTENEKLSAVQLRKDLKRFYTAVHPYLEVLTALYDLIMWKNPLATLLLVLVFVYSLFRGWTVTLLIGLLIFQLYINYLAHVKKIEIGWNFLPRKPVTHPKFDMSGAQLIFDIAKLAQKLLRIATNILEKMECLLTWKNKKVTKVFCGLTVYWLCWTLFFSIGTCIGWTVLAIGIRIFFTTYLVDKFPRLRKRFDTYGYFYRNLPLKSQTTLRNQQLQHQHQTPSRSVRSVDIDDRCGTPNGGNRLSGEKFSSRLGSNFNLDQSAAVNLLLGPNHKVNHQNIQQHSASHLTSFDSNSHLDDPIDQECSIEGHQPGPSSAPLETSPRSVSYSEPVTARSRRKSSSIDEDDDEENEHMSLFADPIIDNVIAFRSCVMNEREKIFPMGITSGILYLTDAAMIFRSRHTVDQKEQLIMLFHDIKHVKKVQSLRSMSLITGTRKSLEIAVEGRRKAVQFIGIAKRDDFVTRVQLMCRNAGANVDFSE